MLPVRAAVNTRVRAGRRPGARTSPPGTAREARHRTSHEESARAIPVRAGPRRLHAGSRGLGENHALWIERV